MATSASSGAGVTSFARGENVSPFELESVMMTHPGVAHCAAVGVPSEVGDDDVLLAVEPVTGADLTTAAARDWCRFRVATFMVPRYVCLAKLELTASERVEREKLDVGLLVSKSTDFGRAEAVR